MKHIDVFQIEIFITARKECKGRGKPEVWATSAMKLESSILGVLSTDLGNDWSYQHEWKNLRLFQFFQENTFLYFSASIRKKHQETKGY